MQKKFKRACRAAAALCSGALLWTAAPLASAESGDAIGALAGVLGGAAMYNVYVNELLVTGNDASNQVGLRAYDIEKNGVDTNKHDIALVDRVMKRLVNRGRYVADIRALPFRWQVNDSEEFNASCYLTDYVSVNRGALRGLNRNEDELASVLGHEMTHGTDMHVVFSTAKTMALYVGATIANIGTGGHIRPDALYMMVMGGAAQNFELPHEYEADEGGFFIMTSAGYNPGGPAAAMAVMQHVIEEEKRKDFIHDYDDPNYDILKNHPDTDKRELKLAGMMTSYSCGHVKVLDRKGVAIDGALLLEAEYTAPDYDNSAENAYLIAGGLAKAFHEIDSLEGWNFRSGENGRIDFLNDDRVYQPLKEAVEKNKAEKRLYSFVKSAYVREQDGRLRQELLQFMGAREAKLEKLRQKNLQTDLSNVEQLYRNADTYNDYFCPELAISEAERIFTCTDYSRQVPGFFAVRGRARALQGDYLGGAEDCDHALELQPTGDAYLYLNRAEVARLQGDAQTALSYARKAEQQGDGKGNEQKLNAVYKMLGDIYDEMGDREKAKDCYNRLLGRVPGCLSIPLSYLKELAPKNAEKVKEQIIAEVKQELGDSFKTVEEREREAKEKAKQEEKEKKAKEKAAQKAAKEKEKKGEPVAANEAPAEAVPAEAAQEAKK